MHVTNARDDPGAGYGSAVLSVGRQRRQLQERSARIDQQVDSFADQKLAALAVTFDHIGPPARRGLGNTRAQGFDTLALRRVIAGIGLRCGQHRRVKSCHLSGFLFLQDSVQEHVGIGA